MAYWAQYRPLRKGKKMKIKFYDNLDYQTDAINSIVDIFKGQEATHTLFGIKTQDIVGTEQTETGIGNRLTLSEDELLKNIEDIQKRNALELTKNIDKFFIKLKINFFICYIINI